ncbi:tryptophan synthase beta chain 2, chloroplastic [Tanacetum coccineum]|uniref:Tryptophan synthase beta chain 2, chloroplastic n=1 Tax=Tanacetum coccineum TaxID=301880 RepID=A0ABQ4XXL8_9ASTR
MQPTHLFSTPYFQFFVINKLAYHLGVEAAGHDLDSGKHAITLTLGSVAGPHPYPMMVHEFQAVIGKETRKQALEKWGGKPDVLVACVGGGLNAMGLFHEFVDDKEVRRVPTVTNIAVTNSEWWHMEWWLGTKRELLPIFDISLISRLKSDGCMYLYATANELGEQTELFFMRWTMAGAKRHPGQWLEELKISSIKFLRWSSHLGLLRWPPKVTVRRLLPHAKGGFESHREGFHSGAKKEWGLSLKEKVRVLHTTQKDVTMSSNH